MWKTFVSNHMDVTWAMDLFVAPTLTFRLLYVFIVVSHERREIIHFGITQHPTMLWVIQQLREATGLGFQPRYVIRDNDEVYGDGVPAFLKSCGIEEVRTAFQSPWQNLYVERMMGTLRRELLDHIIPLNEKHLQRLLTEYIGRYYHPTRTHSSLDHRPPSADLSIEKRQLLPDSALESEPILGGLYHNYRAKTPSGTPTGLNCSESGLSLIVGRARVSSTNRSMNVASLQCVSCVMPGAFP